MANITLRQLHIFSEVLVHGSFRRCAEHMEISQVAVSDHIRELEQRLGHALFERRAGGPAKLTSDGQRAQRHIAKILTEVDHLLIDFAAHADQLGDRRLNFSAQAYILRKLQGTLIEFENQHRGVKIDLDLTVFTAQGVVERLQAKTLDAGYFFALDVPTNLESEYAWTEPLRLFVGPNHPLAGQSRTELADIARSGCIHLLPENPLRPLIDEALKRAGLVDLKIAMQTNELGLILSSVQKGLGFVCMFENSGTGFINPGSLIPLQLEQPLPSLQVRRFVAERWRDDEIARKLLQRLAEQHNGE